MITNIDYSQYGNMANMKYDNSQHANWHANCHHANMKYANMKYGYANMNMPT